MLINTINSTFASALDIAMYIMVYILEGNSEHVHTKKIRPLLIKIFRFVAPLDLNKTDQITKITLHLRNLFLDYSLI